MEFWTILWITVLSGPLDGTTSGLIYPSLEACQDATRTVSDTLAYDHKLECRETYELSASPRPMPRPVIQEARR